MSDSKEKLARVIDYIVRRIGNITSTPMMFGSLETVEFQIVNLIELDMAIRGETSPRYVIEAWQKKLMEIYPGHGPIYMHSILKNMEIEKKHEILVKHMYKFWLELRAETE